MQTRKITQAGLLFAALTFPTAAPAAVSPFAAMAGTWSGGGVLQSSDGTEERLRCRAGYDVAGRAELRLNLRCASASYNFDLTGDVQYHGGAISGSWSEASSQRLRHDFGTRRSRPDRSLGHGPEFFRRTVAVDAGKPAIRIASPAWHQHQRGVTGTGATVRLNRPDFLEAGLRNRHAVGDMARCANVEIEREHRVRAALLGPSDQPAERRLADLGAQ